MQKPAKELLPTHSDNLIEYGNGKEKKTPVGAHGEILWMLVEFCFCAFYSAVPARPQISLDSVRNDTANPPALRIMRIRTKQVLHYGRKLEIQKIEAHKIEARLHAIAKVHYL